MKYRKRPVIIDAIQWTGDNLIEVQKFIENIDELHNYGYRAAEDAWDVYSKMVKDEGLKINTLEGKMSAKIGDYIIRGIEGENYPCDEKIFKKTYEKVEEE